MYRLYYRMRGVPMDRPGGPWWCQDFESPSQADHFLDLHKATLAEARSCPVVIGTESGYPMRIYPPDDAEVVHTCPGPETSDKR